MDNNKEKNVDMKSSSIFKIPRFRVDVVALIVVNVLITTYVWSVLPALFKTDAAFIKGFAVTMPFVFFLAGLAYGIWTKRFPFWEMILTILFSLNFMIDRCYREHLVIGLIITLLGYYFIEVFGVFVGQRYLEKYSSKYKGKTIYKRKLYPNKIIKSVEVAIVINVLIFIIGGIICQFEYILNNKWLGFAVLYVILYYIVGVALYLSKHRLSHIIIVITILLQYSDLILRILSSDNYPFIIGNLLKFIIIYLAWILGFLSCKFIYKFLKI